MLVTPTFAREAGIDVGSVVTVRVRPLFAENLPEPLNQTVGKSKLWVKREELLEILSTR